MISCFWEEGIFKKSITCQFFSRKLILMLHFWKNVNCHIGGKRRNWEVFLVLLLIKVSSSEMSGDSAGKSNELKGKWSCSFLGCFSSKVLSPFETTEADNTLRSVEVSEVWIFHGWCNCEIFRRNVSLTDLQSSWVWKGPVQIIQTSLPGQSKII